MMVSKSIARFSHFTLDQVLILVVMDDGLEVGFHQCGSMAQERVLILVVMDDGLEVITSSG